MPPVIGDKFSILSKIPAWWVVVVTVITMAFWFGQTLQEIKSAIDAMSVLGATSSTDLAEVKTIQLNLETRMRTVEDAATKQTLQTDNLAGAFREVKAELIEINSLIRQFIGVPK